ncbi:MAG TPA: COQ9 family protein [Rhizomicrobium sp.]
MSAEKKSRTRKPRDDAALKRAVVAAALPLIERDGLTESMLKQAADKAGMDRAAQARLFPKGPLDLVEAISEFHDEEMEKRLAKARLSALKVRERIKRAVMTRLEILRPHKEAARRTAAFLTLPPNAATGAKLLYRTVDRMWRAAGDTSTDFNFYTKRAILAGVYSSTLLRWFADDSEEEADTSDFLDARIENVMQFEKFKADWRERTKDWPSLSEILSRFGSSHSRQ